MPIPDPPLYFVSFASADRRDPKLRARMDEFLSDLAARVAAHYPPPGYSNISFFSERTIDVGHLWTADLEIALATCKVGVCLYSNPYFSSTWCGKEFQVLRDRAPQPPAAGIVPVLWMRTPSMPADVTAVQYTGGGLPNEYAEVGIERLRARGVYNDQYEDTVDAIARIVIATATETPLRQSARVNLQATPSAWQTMTARDDRSHTKGSIAKTCFVFAAKEGWAWVPYPDAPEPPRRTIGSVAQEISGRAGVQYEEIPYDADLPQKLREANKSKVPTVLFADPENLLDAERAAPLQEYDTLYLLNCGLLVPWEPAARANPPDKRWKNLTRVVGQKLTVPPPFHEWRSVFSQEDLESSTRTIVEQLKLRLLDQILVAAPPAAAVAAGQAAGDAPLSGEVRPATNAILAATANDEGIDVSLKPQLEVSNK
jgi:hypothetical protein